MYKDDYYIKNVKKKNINIRVDWLIVSAMGYLLFPNLLFLAGWCIPWVSVPLIVALVAAWIYISKNIPLSTIKVTKGDLINIVITLLLCFLIVEFMGFNAHVCQHGDFFVRNPIYSTLVRCDWPIFNRDGQYFVYYLSFWLPPAFFSKIIGECASTYLLIFWVYIGIALAFCIFWIRLRERVLLYMVLLYVFGNVWGWLAMRGSIHFHAQYNNLCAILDSLLSWFSCMPEYVSWRVSTNGTFNHSIPVFLTFSLLMCPAVPRQYLLFISSLMVSGSPLGAITILFVTLSRMRGLYNKMIVAKLGFRWYMLPAVILVLVMGLYYAEQASSVGVRWAWNAWDIKDKGLQYRYIFQQLFGLLLMCGISFFFLKKTRKSALFAAACLILALCSIFMFGMVNNEWMFKGSLIPYCIICYLFVREYRVMSKNKRMMLLIWIFLCSGKFFYDMVKTFRSFTLDSQKMEKNIHNEWQGHLYHPEHWAYYAFWGDESVNVIFYSRDGDSARGVLAPCAMGTKASEEIIPCLTSPKNENVSDK